MHRIDGAGNDDKQFLDGATIITDYWLNALQEEIASIIEDGGYVLNSRSNDNFDQLIETIQTIHNFQYSDRTITSQADFNDCIERTGANAYQIKSGILSMHVVNYDATNGIYCCGTSSFLSGGDTWGAININECQYIFFEQGAFLNFGTGLGHIIIDTDDHKLERVKIKGSVAAAAAIPYGFLIDGNVCNVHLVDCEVNSRRSSLNSCKVFYHSGDAGSRATCTIIDCRVVACQFDSSAYCFYNLRNMSGCAVISCTLSVNLSLYCFFQCTNIVACQVSGCSSAAGSIVCFNLCLALSSCLVYNITTATDLFGFYDCDGVVDCTADTLTSTADDAIGFAQCYSLVSCLADTITGTGAGKYARGFYGCATFSACVALGIVGAGGATANGFNGCSTGSSLYSDAAANASNDWIDTNDAAIANKYSCPAIWT